MPQTFWAVDFWAVDFWNPTFWAGATPPWLLDGPTECVASDYDTNAGLADYDTDSSLGDYTTTATAQSLIIMRTTDTFIWSGTLSAQDPSTLPSWSGATAVLYLTSLDTGVNVIDGEAVTLNTTTLAWSINSATAVPPGNYVGYINVTFVGPTIRSFPNFVNLPLQVIAAAA